MFRKIVFFNNLHNGDLNFSRGFVNYIVKNFKYEFEYHHIKDKNILKDLDVKFINEDFLKEYNHARFFTKDNVLYLNTWIGAENHNYMFKYGLTFDCIYKIFNDTMKECLDTSLDGIDPSKLFPAINFSKFNISNVDKWILDHKNSKKVYISNGYVESCQCDNSNWNSLIIYFANKHKDIDFLISNKIEPLINLKNVFYTGDIINSSCCDLNENGYISTFCDLIIGRASGAGEFARNTTNLFERNCNIITFSNMQTSIGRDLAVHEAEIDDQFVLGEFFRNKIQFSSNCINYKNHNIDFAMSILEDYI